MVALLRVIIGVSRYERLATARQVHGWTKKALSPPAPRRVKHMVLERHGIPGAAWVETGTHAGTTASFLSARAPTVYTIEPSRKYFELGLQKFAETNVNILNGTSETILPDLLPSLRGDLNFWLDGHYSGDDTFLGAVATPILSELREISLSLRNLQNVTIFIDDFRCFVERDGLYGIYPAPDTLVSWGAANNFSWTVEHDIFILKRMFYA